MKKARMKRKQRRKLIWMVAGLVVLLYLGLAVYFHNHFFPKTTLNGRKAGGYTAQKVMDEIKNFPETDIEKYNTCRL